MLLELDVVIISQLHSFKIKNNVLYEKISWFLTLVSRLFVTFSYQQFHTFYMAAEIYTVY